MSPRLRPPLTVPQQGRPVASKRQRDHIQADLERLGVPDGVRGELAHRLEALSRHLSPEAYDAALAGVALANGLHREEEQVLRRSLRDLEEIQLLIGGFSDELRKLDEALRILSTYVRRMRSRAGPVPPKTVH
jgi:hypothetical protein